MPVIDKRGTGKYHNRITDTEPNSGSRGKLNSEQLAERVVLHAKRRALGEPTVAQITQIWWDKYNIQMHPQTEKTWASSEANSIAIDRKIDELVESGEIQVASITDPALVNTLAVGAKEHALTLKDIGKVMRRHLKDFDSTTKDEKGEDVEKSLVEKKMMSSILKNLSSVAKVHGEGLTEMIKVATGANKSAGLLDSEVRRQAKMLAAEEKGKDSKKKENQSLADLTDFTEVAQAREGLEKEHGIK